MMLRASDYAERKGVRGSVIEKWLGLNLGYDVE